MEELKTWWHGAHQDHDHFSTKNLVNAFLFFTCFLPSIFWIKNLYSKDAAVVEIEVE